MSMPPRHLKLGGDLCDYRVSSLALGKSLTIWICSLEHNEKAQEDASKALSINKNNSKAILAKAEALFCDGNFELGKIFLINLTPWLKYKLWKINILALVAFERGSKIFRNAEIEAGRSKMSASIPVISHSTPFSCVLLVGMCSLLNPTPACRG